MEYYTEQAESYEACIRKIEAVHGRSYKILNHKEIISSGFLGFGRKQRVEISYRLVGASSFPWTAAANPVRPAVSPARPATAPLAGPQRSFPAAAAPSSSASQQPLSPLSSHAADFEAQKQRFLADTKVDPSVMVLKEIQSLRTSIEQSSLRGETRDDEHESIIKIRELLSRNDFSFNYIKRIESRLRSEFSISALEDFQELQSRVLEWIGEDIKIAPVGPFPVRPHVFVLVGPTGVGKTTTIAKIAALFSIGSAVRRPLSVRMLTIDTYRIGAKDQLKTYGKIMNVPVSTVDSAEDLRKILAMYQDAADLILVDTIGKSPKDYTKLGEMKSILSPITVNGDFHLAVSATTKYSDLVEIFRQFEPFAYHSVVVTKIDETMRVGNLISVLYEKGKSLSYIADGQKVPSNLERASVIRLLINLEGFSVDRRRLEARFPPEEGEMRE